MFCSRDRVKSRPQNLGGRGLDGNIHKYTWAIFSLWIGKNPPPPTN